MVVAASDRDSPQELETAPMRSEKRRGGPRGKLDQFVYINLNSGNGGILLDVSDRGLGLQAAAHLGAAGPIRFRLSVGSIDQVEAAGELLWIDDKGKRAGLRFTHVPEEVREQLRIWLGQPRLTFPFGEDSAPTPLAQVEFAPHRERHLVPIEANQSSHANDVSDFLPLAESSPARRPRT